MNIIYNFKKLVNILIVIFLKIFGLKLYLIFNMIYIYIIDLWSINIFYVDKLYGFICLN